MTNNEVTKISCIGKKTNSQKQKSSINRVSVKRVFAGCCAFKLPKIPELSPLNFLKQSRCKIAKCLCLWSKPSSRVSSLGRSKPSIANIDTHRSKAIEDCIKFINSSSTSASTSASSAASLPESTSASSAASLPESTSAPTLPDSTSTPLPDSTSVPPALPDSNSNSVNPS